MEPSPNDEPEGRFPIVGIGASAGGLEALTALIREFTLDSTAFVVVQHLSPHHESMLPELLGRATSMPVCEVTNGMRIEPNRIYVAPPDVNVAVLHGVLHLVTPRAPLPIDYFFRSLAQDLGPAAIGVVLSGLGSDGTFGLREIKARGGLAFAQEPSSAKFASMPQSAIDSGVVDRVFPPAEIGAELMALSHHHARRPRPLPVPADELGRLFVILRASFGHDLSLYKPTTITRRIERRMALCKLESLADYVRFAQENTEELQALYRDLLISVTSFFRDVEPFDAIRDEILPHILERKRAGDTIRVWSPACASGEEVYSLAICLLEAVEASGQSRRVQIFGTDVDASAIARARIGVYPPNIELDVQPARLAKYFTRVGAGYQVVRRVRDSIVFSTQNVAQDPPFSRLDLVSCRNILIYLQPALQKRVLRILHYALTPDGYLVLGNSETVGDSADLFSLVDRKNKVYVKKNLPSVVAFDAYSATERRGEAATTADADRRPPMTAQQLADRKVLDRYAPPSVLVNENLEVLQFRGDTGPFLSPASGAATLQLIKLLRPELHVEVWRALQEALQTNAAVRVANLTTDAMGPGVTFGASVLPIVEPETRSRCLLLVFETQSGRFDPRATPVLSETEPRDADRRVSDLEEELKSTKEYLQTTIEELEASNEELKSTNEELQSSNEELQSTNEELETSKEELQSTNEELTSLNDENHERMAETAQNKADLANLLARIDSAVVFVGADLRIRRITDHAQAALDLSSSDLGRPIGQLKGVFGHIDVASMVRRASDRLEPTTDHFRDAGGRWLELRAFPYRTSDDRVEGGLLVVRDVHEEMQRKQLILNVEDYAGKLLAAIPNPLLIVDESLRVLWVNAPFLDYFQTSVHETIGNLMQNLDSGQWGHPRLRATMEETLTSGHAFRDFEIRHTFERLGEKTMRLSGSRIEQLGDTRRVLLLSVEDVPESRAGSAGAP